MEIMKQSLMLLTPLSTWDGKSVRRYLIFGSILMVFFLDDTIFIFIWKVDFL